MTIYRKVVHMKNNKQKLFEIMCRLDKTFKPKLNEENETSDEKDDNENISSKEISEIKGFHTNIEEETVNNDSFRKVLYTASNLQLVLMSLKPGEEIGEEVHEDIDQFFRIDGGNGICIINGNEYELTNGSAIIVPKGSKHNIINNGNEPLKLYTIYSPPNHKDGVEFKTKEEASQSEEKFDGETTEK